MVDMGDDGDIAYRLRHREFFLFVQAAFPSSEGGSGVGRRHGGELPHSAAPSILPAALRQSAEAIAIALLPLTTKPDAADYRPEM
jgi:hypothetical protein